MSNKYEFSILFLEYYNKNTSTIFYKICWGSNVPCPASPLWSADPSR
jgi:hypothetical protein